MTGTSGVPEWVLIVIVGVILSAIGWGVRRLLEGQDTGVKELKEISTAVTKICGNVELANQRLEIDKDICDERHKNNKEEHDRMLEALDKFRST